MSGDAPSPTRTKKLRRAFFASVLLALAGNAVVYAHAWRFTHFVTGGARTENPEALTGLQRFEVLFTGVRVPRPTLRASLADAGLVGTTERFGPIEVWRVPAGHPSAPDCRAAAIGACADDTVLLFHGYAGARSDLVGDAAVFHARGLNAVLVDFPGSGGSDGNTTTLGWQEAEVVRDMAERLRPADGRLVLFGKSMGAAAILRAVGDLGVVADRLVLENPYDRLVTTAGHRFEAMGLPAFPFAPLLVFWGGVQLGYNGFALAPVESATHIRTPTMLMIGAVDERVHLGEIEAIHAALLEPRYDVVVFPGVGHVGLRTAQSELWGAAVDRALAGG